MPLGALVRVGRSTRVFRIRARGLEDGEPLYLLTAGADHPDAGKRVQNAFRAYTEAELTRVRDDRGRVL